MPTTDHTTVVVSNEEQLHLAKISEAQLRAAAARAEATAHQATADRFRLEGNEQQARAFEDSSDAALRTARGYHATYTRLILGRGAGAVITAAG